jgi:diguanylate cyclase (GGDEF)-like protein
MLDLDDFKLVNDSFGHLYGDRVLVHAAEQIRACLRGSDVAARYGGDEFALILPETDREGAVAVAERIIDAFRLTPMASDGRQPIPIGASVGIATHPKDGRTPTELIALADLGLYDAKSAGGNLVRLADARLAALPGGLAGIAMVGGHRSRAGSVTGSGVGSGDR